MSSIDHRGGSSREMTGLLIVVLGFGLLLHTMNILPFGWIFAQYWFPGMFVIIGLILLVNSQSHGSRMGGLFFIAFGALIVLGRSNLGFNPWRMIGPLIVIWIGVSILTKNMGQRESRIPGGRPPRPPRPERPVGIRESVDPSDFITATAFLGGYERRCTSQNFKGADLSAFLGGGKVDLREARIAGGTATIDVFTLMGGIELLVPSDWIVINEITPVLGGCEDTTRPPREGGSRVTLRGTAVMGGVSLKN